MKTWDREQVREFQSLMYCRLIVEKRQYLCLRSIEWTVSWISRFVRICLTELCIWCSIITRFGKQRRVLRLETSCTVDLCVLILILGHERPVTDDDIPAQLVLKSVGSRQIRWTCIFVLHVTPETMDELTREDQVQTSSEVRSNVDGRSGS